MAVIKAVSSRAGITQALDYVMKEEKTEGVCRSRQKMKCS